MEMRRKITKLLRPIFSPFINRVRLSDLLFLGAVQKDIELVQTIPYVYISHICIQNKEYPVIFKRTLFRGDLMLGLDGRKYDKLEVQKKDHKEIQLFMAAGAVNEKSGLPNLIRQRILWSMILLAVAVLTIILFILNIIVYNHFLLYTINTATLVGVMMAIAFLITISIYHSIQ